MVLLLLVILPSMAWHMTGNLSIMILPATSGSASRLGLWERVAEYYYATGNAMAKSLLDKMGYLGNS